MKTTLILLAINIGLLAGCTKVVYRHKVVKQPVVVHQYKQKVAPAAGSAIDQFVYWYVIFSDNATYSYRSSIPVSSFGAVSFTRTVGNALPKDVREEVEESEEMASEEITEVTDLPDEMATEVETVDQVDTEAGSNDPGDTGADSGTSDGGSGSSDSGGGSDGGGGGGGE